MNFLLESYDTRNAVWLHCQLFEGDFTSCRTLDEAQLLLDRVAASRPMDTFRVTVVCHLEPSRLYAECGGRKIYELEHLSPHQYGTRELWLLSNSFSVEELKCRNDKEAASLLAKARESALGIRYRMLVTSPHVTYFIE